MKKMGRFLKKNDILLGSPKETLGFTKDYTVNQLPVIQNFLIKKYNFNSIEQSNDIKKQLLSRRILIINTKELFENDQIPIDQLKQAIEDLKIFLRQSGGSLGRLGEHYLIMTPNKNIKMGF